jgi:hypothetical protein
MPLRPTQRAKRRAPSEHLSLIPAPPPAPKQTVQQRRIGHPHRLAAHPLVHVPQRRHARRLAHRLDLNHRDPPIPAQIPRPDIGPRHRPQPIQHVRQPRLRLRLRHHHARQQPPPASLIPPGAQDQIAADLVRQRRRALLHRPGMQPARLLTHRPLALVVVVRLRLPRHALVVLRPLQERVDVLELNAPPRHPKQVEHRPQLYGQRCSSP